MYTTGIDVFAIVPRAHQEKMFCRACQSECDVKRDQYGAISWAGSMARTSHKHDLFTCPHAGKDWHNTAVRLLQEMEATASDRLHNIMALDLEEVVATGLGAEPSLRRVRTRSSLKPRQAGRKAELRGG
jgi:hypothetical protein